MTDAVDDADARVAPKPNTMAQEVPNRIRRKWTNETLMTGLR
jgi:hypothetical protein